MATGLLKTGPGVGTVLLLLLASAPLPAQGQVIKPLTFWQAPQWWRYSATIDMDFINDRYWLNGTQYNGLTNFITGATATYARASTATYYDISGNLQTAAVNAARLDYDTATNAPRGVLIEESRTNGIVNNTMQGIAAGTPGTLPTNWNLQTNLTGLSSQVVGSGTENNINYIDLRLYGTPALNGNVTLSFTPTYGTNAYAAGTAAILSESAFVKLQAGSLSNVGALSLQMAAKTVAGLDLGSVASQAITPTAVALSKQRYSVSSTATTFTNALTTYIIPGINFTTTSGSAINVTLRIGMPQIEIGAQPSSVIATTTAAVTRSADNFTIPATAAGPSGAWYTSGIGTLSLSDVVPNPSAPTIATGVALDDGTASNALQIFTSANYLRTSIIVAAANVYTNTGLLISTLFLPADIIMAFQPNNVGSAAEGKAGTASSSATIPTINLMRIGAGPGTQNYLNGWISRIWYIPTRQPDFTLPDYTN